MKGDDAIASGPVASALENLGIQYYIGGSVASSTHGISRTTADIDFVAAIRAEHADAFAAQLGDDYYVDRDMIREAIRERSSFNIIHRPTMVKVDVFVAGVRRFDKSVAERIVLKRPFEDEPRQFPLASAEDIVLKKLEWFRMGGEVSERQWLDVVSVIKVQGERLDLPYLRQWAEDLQVRDLLERALAETNESRQQGPGR